MKVLDIRMEDFLQYKKPSLFIITTKCDWKCCIELNLDTSICQNNPLYKNKVLDISNESIYEKYINNPITQSIVIGGLEPFYNRESTEEVISLIKFFRDNNCEDEFVIYTGYYDDEIQDIVKELRNYKNIIIKFGRYVPNQEQCFDKALGVFLASDNQYAEKIS